VMELAVVLALPMKLPATLILASDGSVVFQQTTNSPCVIGNPSCNQGGLVYNQWTSTPGGSQGSTYDLFSPVYVIGSGSGISAPNVIPSQFSIGIDINYSTGFGLENLEFFKTWICSDAAGVACLPSDANSYFGPAALAQQNGNGYSDAALLGINLDVGQYVKFEASVSNDTDGMEQFFLLPPQEIPEPSTSALVGAGLLAVAYIFRRKKA
jgi:hypothetical protein